VKLHRLTFAITICFLLTLRAQSMGQGRPTGSSSPPHAQPTPAPDLTGEGNRDEEERHATLEMEKKANLQRQAALKKDTDKLLKLAEELKDSVDKSSSNVLSLEVVKKAEEIEKLAHSVKDKMRGPN
jgi:hypothetical protein